MKKQGATSALLHPAVRLRELFAPVKDADYAGLPPDLSPLSFCGEPWLPLRSLSD
jgi:hypothetical protein